MSKVKNIEEDNGRITWVLECPGCECQHMIWSGAGPRPVWAFNGDTEKPTFSPSLLVTMGLKPDPVTHLAPKGAPKQICHSFIRDGKIEYLGDCTHPLAGQTIDLPEVEW